MTGPEQFILSPSQGIQILAISELLRAGGLAIQGDDAETAECALADIAQEIALQFGAEPTVT